jgi:hypothetical protein
MEKKFVPGENHLESSKELVNLLKHLRDDYSNEIPEEIISGRPATGNILKCQKNWFQTLIFTLADAQEHLENAGKDLPDGFAEFYERVTSETFQYKKRVSREDIEEADDVLAKTINALEA